MMIGKNETNGNDQITSHVRYAHITYTVFTQAHDRMALGACHMIFMSVLEIFTILSIHECHNDL